MYGSGPPKKKKKCVNLVSQKHPLFSGKMNPIYGVCSMQIS